MHTGTDDSSVMIRRISKDTIADIEQLHFSVYDTKATPGHYLQKFATGYTGIDYACFLAYTADGRPVSSFCLVPCFIIYEGRRILAAQCTDAMTDPAFRKKGLFSALEKEALAMAKEEGIELLFVFPNQDSHPLLVKKGWAQTGEMDIFWIPVKRSLQWLISLVLRRGNKAPRIEEAGCANSVLTDGFAGIDRSKEYFLYKSFTNTRVINSDSGKAWVKGGHYFTIGDMEVKKENFKALIRRVCAMTARTATQKLFFQCSRGTGLHKLFAENYEARVSFPVMTKTIGQGIVAEKVRFTFADIDIF